MNGRRRGARIFSNAWTEEGIRLGELAVAQGKIRQEQLDRALEAQRAAQPPRPLGQILIEAELLTTGECAELLIAQERLCGAANVKRVDRFLLLHELGRGGSGVVWRAWDPQLNRPAALKMLHADDESERGLLLREARTAAQLSHPNIVSVYEILTHDGSPCIAMELVEGKTLDEAARGRPLEQALAWVRDAARAVHCAHERGVIHRDLKPQNIIIRRDGTVCVTDFGLAKEWRAPSHSTVVRGTPGFIAPEQLMGKRELLGPRTDVYALGATLCALAGGRLPELQELVGEAATQSPRTTSGIPPAVATIVEKAMEKNPERRYASAAALADDLDRHRKGEGILARPTPGIVKAFRLLRRHPVAAAMCLALLASLAWGGSLWRSSSQRRRAAVHLEEARRALDEANRGLYLQTSGVESVRASLRRAEGAVDRALHLDPNLPEAYFIRGQIREFEGSDDAAEADYGRTLQLDRDFTPCRIRRALHRLKRKMTRVETLQSVTPETEAAFDAADVAAELEQALASGSGAREEDLAYARIAIRIARKQYDEALRRCEEALSRTEAEELLHLRAFVLHRLGQDTESMRSLERAIRLKHYDLVARRALAHLRTHSRQWPEAIAQMDVVCALWPDVAESWLARSWMHTRNRDFARALSDVNRVLELDPNAAVAYYQRAAVHNHAGRPEAALPDCDTAIRLWHALYLPREEALARVLRANMLALVGRTEEAAADADEAERLSPGLADAALVRGIIHICKGETDLAIPEFERATRSDPGSDLAWQNLGTAYAEKRRCEEAILAYSRALEADPTCLAAYEGRAWCRVHVNRPAESLRDFDTLVQLLPESPRVWTNRATLRRALKDRAAAQEDVDRALRLDENFAGAWLQKAFLSMDLEDWKTAREAADRAVRGFEANGGTQVEDRLLPRRLDRANAFLARGLARYRLGEVREGLEDVASAIRIDPSYAEAYYNRGLLLEKSDPAAALADFRKSVSLNPRQVPAWIHLGQLLLDTGDDEGGEAALEKVVELQPDRADVWLTLGVLRHRRHRFEDAVRAYTRALESKPNWGLAWTYRSLARYKLHDFAGSEEDARAAVRSDPADPGGHEALGYALREQGKREEAVDAFSRALEQDPTRIKSRIGRGKTLDALRRDAEALADLERAIREKPALQAELQQTIDEIRRRQKP